tara:strand:+ start:5540 stop:6007 length:468 start_codon:yes stop_codon:yes gene_type:complete
MATEFYSKAESDLRLDNRIKLEKKIFEATSEVNSFVSASEMTTYWNDKNTSLTPPEDTKEFFRKDLNQLWRWNSTLPAKAEFSRIIPDQIEVKIEEAYVLTAGKSNLSVFEINDKFRAWLGDRYVVGKIISLLTDTFANSVNDDTKIKLTIDSEI